MQNSSNSLKGQLNSHPFNRRNLLSGCGLSLCALLTPYDAVASSMKPLSFSQLRRQSEHICCAKVMTHKSMWLELGGRKRLVTEHSLQELETFKGIKPGSANLKVFTLGGRKGNLAQKVHGAAQIIDGEEGVFFIASATAGISAIVGMAQGHFPLRKTRSLEKLVTRDHFFKASSAPFSLPFVGKNLKHLRQMF